MADETPPETPPTVATLKRDANFQWRIYGVDSAGIKGLSFETLEAAQAVCEANGWQTEVK